MNIIIVLILGLISILENFIFSQQEVIVSPNLTFPSSKKQTKNEIIIKTDPLDILIGPVPLVSSAYGIYTELPLSSSTSIEPGIAYMDKNLFLSAFIDMDTSLTQPQRNLLKSLNYRGVKISLMYRHYINALNDLLKDLLNIERNMSGLYWGAIVSYAYFKVSSWDPFIASLNYVLFEKFNTGIIMGIQLIFFSRVTTDFYLGAGYKENIFYVYQNGRQVRKITSTGQSPDFYFSHFKLYLNFKVGFAITSGN